MNTEILFPIAITVAIFAIIFWIISCARNDTLHDKCKELIKEIAETRRLEADELQYLSPDEIVEAFSHDIEGTTE